MDWETQRICTDIGEYELVIEKLKQRWDCDQTMESWKWSVVRHGAVLERGVAYDLEDAKKQAVDNVPSEDK